MLQARLRHAGQLLSWSNRAPKPCLCPAGLAGGVEGMFRQQAEAAASSHWQIVAIAPSAADPGEGAPDACSPGWQWQASGVWHAVHVLNINPQTAQP